MHGDCFKLANAGFSEIKSENKQQADFISFQLHKINYFYET